MADITVTASSVAPITGTTNNTLISQGTAGATITQGVPLYADATAANQLKPTANGAANTAQVVGIALNSASAGQPVTYAIGGDLTFGSGLTKGIVYVVSTNSGKIAPTSDLIAGNYVTVLGVATGAGTLRLGLITSGQTQ
jgi:hypothetical protein